MKDRYETQPLRADERPRYIYEYYVTGSGDFPFDMLRYDACWPADGEDAAKMSNGAYAEPMKLRSIRMRSYREPTIARWSSFVWSVGLEKLD